MFRNRNQCRFTAALEIRRLSFFPGRLLTWYCLHGHCANSKVSLISGRGGNTWPLCVTTKTFIHNFNVDLQVISEIIEQWKVELIQLNPPATIDSIKRAEQIVHYTFPPDFKELYLISDGFKDRDWRPNMFSLWPLQRIIDEYSEELSRNTGNSSYQDEHARNFVGFCDYLINIHQIGFFKNSIGVYKSYDEFNPIAQSFTEALQLINKDADLIY